MILKSYTIQKNKLNQKGKAIKKIARTIYLPEKSEEFDHISLISHHPSTSSSMSATSLSILPGSTGISRTKTQTLAHSLLFLIFLLKNLSLFFEFSASFGDQPPSAGSAYSSVDRLIFLLRAGWQVPSIFWYRPPSLWFSFAWPCRSITISFIILAFLHWAFSTFPGVFLSCLWNSCIIHFFYHLGWRNAIVDGWGCDICFNISLPTISTCIDPTHSKNNFKNLGWVRWCFRESY